MVYSYNFSSGTEISIEEYLDWVSHNVDEKDVQSLSDSAFMLYRLSLNRDLFTEILLSPVKDSLSEIQPENQYTDATFILGKAKEDSLLVRANLWRSPKAWNGSNDYENILYSYDIPHDHNFDFLTVGYFGPGYTTDIYNYSRDEMEIIVGEPANLKFIETTTLPVGKVMLFEKSKDIHTQRPPISPSISVNLICVTEEQSIRQQCFFDIEKNVLSGYASGPTNSRVQVIKMIGHLGLAGSVDLLMDVVKQHPCVRTRAASIDSILSINAALRQELYTICGSDTHPLIRAALGGDGTSRAKEMRRTAELV